MKLSVCIPVYNGAATIGRLVDAVEAVLVSTAYDFEIVMVNDGSKDDSDAVCSALAEKHDYITYVCLRKNSGEHNAVMCALTYATGDAAVIIDDDFQNPPEEILKLVEELQKGFDVVYARYGEKKHSLFRNLGSAFNDRMATFLLKKPKNLYLCSFKAIARPLIDEIVKYRGPFPYIDGLILRATDSVSTVLVRHESRASGESNYTLGKLVTLWLNMFINFSIKPLRVIALFGLAISGGSVLMLFKILLERWLNPSLPPGWASVIVLVLFFGGIQLISIGLIGEYVGKAYLDLNGTPQWTIRKVHLSRKAR